jgi:AcrR family transcriptional regulator
MNVNKSGGSAGRGGGSAGRGGGSGGTGARAGNTQAGRSRATRAKLVRAARHLFARRGFAAVGTEQIVRRAGVTRGALYHHFADKEDLFLAVYEDVERELTERVAASLAGASGPLDAMRRAVELFLDACQTAEVQRIVLLDGPAVLGWDRWREVAERYGLGLTENALAAAIDAGEIDALPTRPLAHLLMGALDEAAMMVAREPQLRAQAGAALTRLLDGLRPRAASD